MLEVVMQRTKCKREGLVLQQWWQSQDKQRGYPIQGLLCGPAISMMILGRGKNTEKRQHVSHASINLIGFLRYNLSIMPDIL